MTVIAVIIISLLACIGTIMVALVNLRFICLPALFGALVLLSSGLLPWPDAVVGLTANSGINPLKILTLFLSIALFSIFLDEIGFFKYLADKAVQIYRGKQVWLFVVFYVLISILGTFTSNYLIILTFTPFICYFSKNAKIDPIPYLVSGFVAANTASMFLITGNPTNAYLATKAGIDSSTYLNIMALPTTFALITAFVVLFAIFYKQLKQPIADPPENEKLKQKRFLAKFLCTIICRVPWEVIPLVLSMFVIVLAFESSGATEKIVELLNFGNSLFTYGIYSTLATSLINNIPMSVLFSSFLSVSGQEMIATYATIIGANIGAYLTPIGALAGIMLLRILHDKGIEHDFGKFVTYGIYVAIPTLLAALIGLLFVYTQNISLNTLSMANILTIMGNILGVVILVAFIELLFFQKFREIFKNAKKQKAIDSNYIDIFEKQKAADSIYMSLWWIFIFISGIFLYMFGFFQIPKAETETLFNYIFYTIAISIEASIRMFTSVFNYKDVRKIADSNWIYHSAIVICYLAAIFWTTKIAEKFFLRRITNELRLLLRTNKLILWLRTKFSLVNDYHYIIIGCEKSMKAFLVDLQKTVSKDNIIIITGLPIENKADSNTYFKKIIEAGYVAIDGKADEEALENAGIDNTWCKIRVVAITESDEQNLTVAHIITDKIKIRQKKNKHINLEAYIMYSSIERTEYFVFAEEAHGKVDFFNPYELRARDFFEKHPITSFIPHFIDTKKARLKGEFNSEKGKIYKEDGKEYLIKNIFIGFGATNYQMLKGSILTGQLLGCDYYATIYEEKPSKHQDMLKNFSKGLFSFLNKDNILKSSKEKYNIVFKNGNVLSRDFYIDSENGLMQEIKKNDFTTIYIALGKDQFSVETACEIRQFFYENDIKKDKVRIFVKISEETVFSKDSVINQKEDSSIPIECFGWNTSIFTKDYIVNESLDKFAKTVTNKNHEKSWELLTEIQRDINRQVAIAIKTKLHLLGLDLKDKSEKKVEYKDYYIDYIGDGNDKISKIIELSKKIASHNNAIEKLYELKQGIEKIKEELKKFKAERSNYILDYVRFDNDNCGEKISDTPRNNLARLEHLRWNTFYLIHGWTKMPESMVGASNSELKNKLTKQHACITTFEKLIELRKLQARKNPEISDKEAQEKADTIWYDYNLMDELPIRLQNSEKVICKTLTKEST
jgi:arsenical pump membrane protein